MLAVAVEVITLITQLVQVELAVVVEMALHQAYLVLLLHTLVEVAVVLMVVLAVLAVLVVVVLVLVQLLYLQSMAQQTQAVEEEVLVLAQPHYQEVAVQES